MLHKRYLNYLQRNVFFKYNIIKFLELNKIGSNFSKIFQIVSTNHMCTTLGIQQCETVEEDIIENVKSFDPKLCKANYKRNEKVNAIYLFEENVARKFATLIASDLIKSSAATVEVNPGPCYLTKELLKAGVKKIYLFEENPIYHSSVEKLQGKYPNCLELKHVNLFKIKQFQSKHKYNVEETFKCFTEKKWEEEVYLNFVGIAMNKFFISFILLNTIYGNNIMKFGRVRFYLAVPPSMWQMLTFSDTDNYSYYTSKAILFQLLFNYEILGCVNRKAFFPKTRKIYKRKIEIDLYKDDDEFMYITKLEPKSNFYTDFIAQEDLKLFWLFLRHNLYSRKTRVIPELERWAPGCGEHLISYDYNIFTEFGQLKPLEFVKLFKLFVSLPNLNKIEYAIAIDSKQTNGKLG
ncbi:dimethyladenosine transferase 2, mitochondrial [Prorops nasuta]|uniref:dimethyladenosine transferase 2, mitochondrial n=1 Tax=Prorops nasuta TaxID=863751 RepID=UPI0034CF738D